MTKLEELQAKVLQLQTSLDTKQAALELANAQKQAALDAANALIDAGAGVTNEDLQGVIDSLNATKEDLEATPE